MQLHAAGGDFLLAAATFSTDGCGEGGRHRCARRARCRRRRRRAAASAAAAAVVAGAAAPPRRRRRRRRRAAAEAQGGRGGAVGRRPPLRPSADVACAAGVVAAGVRVAVQSECAGDAPTVTTPAPTLRAELGAPFMLSLEHFPLELHVTHARAAAGAAAPPPLLAFAFHTTEVRWASRWALWVGAPLAFLFLACCCCLCVGCCAVAPRATASRWRRSTSPPRPPAAPPPPPRYAAVLVQRRPPPRRRRSAAPTPSSHAAASREALDRRRAAAPGLRRVDQRSAGVGCASGVLDSPRLWWARWAAAGGGGARAELAARARLCVEVARATWTCVSR